MKFRLEALIVSYVIILCSSLNHCETRCLREYSCSKLTLGKSVLDPSPEYINLEKEKDVITNYSFETDMEFMIKRLNLYGSCKILHSSVYSTYTQCHLQTESILFINNNCPIDSTSKTKLLIFIPGLNGLCRDDCSEAVNVALKDNSHLLLVDYTATRTSSGMALTNQDKKAVSRIPILSWRVKNYYVMHVTATIQKALSVLYKEPMSDLKQFLRKHALRINIVGYSFGGHMAQQLLRGPISFRMHNVVLVAPALFRIPLNNLEHPGKISITIVWGSEEQILHLKSPFGILDKLLDRIAGFRFNPAVTTKNEASEYRKRKDVIFSLVVVVPFSNHSLIKDVLRYICIHDLMSTKHSFSKLI